MVESWNPSPLAWGSRVGGVCTVRESGDPDPTRDQTARPALCLWPLGPGACGPSRGVRLWRTFPPPRTSEFTSHQHAEGTPNSHPSDECAV